MLSVGIVQKYRELSKVYSGKELIDHITEFVVNWKKELKKNKEKNLSIPSEYHYIGDVEYGFLKVKSIFIRGIEYLVDTENNVYDALNFDKYGLLLQTGIYDSVDGTVKYVDPSMV